MPGVLQAASPALFISDLHLSEDEPATVDAFIDFLNGPAREAGSLFILGDLFEYWAGDDDIDSVLSRRICDALATLATRGMHIHYMTGNRDLLAGSGFATRAKVALLPDPSCVRIGDQVLLISHGDALCTDDVPYQRYRQQVRDPAWQAGFLAQPLSARKAFIESLRKQSETAKREKAMTIMDVNADAVAELLRQHSQSTCLIHGHTHRPAHHEILVDGRICERWVLADWHGEASWLAFDGKHFSVGGQSRA